MRGAVIVVGSLAVVFFLAAGIFVGWGEAAVLLVGLVAAPIVLSKKSDEAIPESAGTSTSTQAQAPKGPDELAQVKLTDEGSEGTGSSLSSFGVSNPFAPPKEVTKKDQPQTSAAGADLTTTTDTTGISKRTSVSKSNPLRPKEPSPLTMSTFF